MNHVARFARSPFGILSAAILVTALIFVVLNGPAQSYRVLGLVVLALCVVMHFMHAGHHRHGDKP